MTPEQWRRVEDVFQAAVDLPQQELAAFLDRECAGEEWLRLEVETLLGTIEQSRRQLRSPIQSAARDFAESEDTALIGQRIGPYLVKELLGQGGMGSVYRASRDDDNFVKDVAIKVIRQGMSTAFIRGRFLQERQILAQLDHPNVARLLDGGTTQDGLPFLVMEYVEGSPIVAFCDSQRLTTEQRVRLFLDVCDAVQHAHFNLIVHRDLKPGNILVSDKGEPKLIDFGIAKILDPNPDSTGPQAATAIRMMTPEYTSPEQVMGRPITAATDVYALGAILYEVLSGQRAHALQSHSPFVIDQVVVRQDPVAPSEAAARAGLGARRARDIRGDLDNIVLMAMRKEPERRYHSAGSLAQDLRNYLGGLPVVARPSTLHYRTTKFVQRHRAAVALSALLVVSLAGGMFFTWREAARANRRFSEVRGFARAMLYDVHSKLEHLPGSTEARALLVGNVTRYLDNLAREAWNDESLHRELATAYEQIGDLQGSPYAPNLGNSKEAEQSYRKAVSHWKQVISNPKDSGVQQGLIRCYYRLGDVQRRLGERKAAWENFLVAMKYVETLDEQADPVLKLRYLSAGHIRLGDMNYEGGLQAEKEHYEKARVASDTWARLSPDNRSRSALATSLFRVARHQARVGDLEKAEASFRDALRVRQELVKVDPKNTGNSREMIPLWYAIGNVLGYDIYPNLGRKEEALEAFSQGLALAETNLRKDPRSAQARYDVLIGCIKVGSLVPQNQPAAALAYADRALKIIDELAAGDKLNMTYGHDLVFLLPWRAQLLQRLGRPVEGRAALLRAQDLHYQMQKTHPGDEQLRQSLADLLMQQARFELSQRSYASALNLARQSVATRVAVDDIGPDVGSVDTYSRHHETVAQVYDAIATNAPSADAKALNNRLGCEQWQQALTLWDRWKANGATSTFANHRSDEVAQHVGSCRQTMARINR